MTSTAGVRGAIMVCMSDILIRFQPVEADGQHWVQVRWGDIEFRRGPLPDAAAAIAETDALARAWRNRGPCRDSDRVVIRKVSKHANKRRP
jgi:hypothetical protein